MPKGKLPPKQAKAKPTAPKTKPASPKWKAAPASEAPPPAPAAEKPLTANEERFCQEYLIDVNGTQAYLRANPNVATVTARTEGSRTLAKPNVAARIAQLQAARAEKTEINAERVLKELWSIATADPRELVEHIVGCCRHCFGEGFGFQRTLGEMNRDMEAWQEKGKNPADFEQKGGIGFDPRKPPNPECPECFGKGRGRTFLNDTRNLSAGAAALYAGVKETKDGFEVKLHSKLDAIEKLVKHLGLYERDNKQKTDPLSTLLAGLGRSALPIVKEPPPDE